MVKKIFLAVSLHFYSIDASPKLERKIARQEYTRKMNNFIIDPTPLPRPIIDAKQYYGLSALLAFNQI